MWKNLRTVWKFVIIFVLLQIVVGLVSGGNLLWVLILTIFAWGVLLAVPCIIRYGFKKIISKKWAILYTVLSAIVLLFGNAIISIIFKEIFNTERSITLWNLIMMIIPYYVLIDEPIFSKKDNKTE